MSATGDVYVAIDKRETPLAYPRSEPLIPRGSAAYTDAGRLDAAITLLEQVYAQQSSTLGDKNPMTLVSRHNLARARREACGVQKPRNGVRPAPSPQGSGCWLVLVDQPSEHGIAIDPVRWEGNDVRVVARGITVVGTGADRDIDRVTKLGATAVRYGEGWVERVVKAAAPGGTDFVFDASGAGVLAESVALVGDPGRVITIADPSFAEYELRFTGSDPADRFFAEALPQLADLIAAGKLDVAAQLCKPALCVQLLGGV